jgi:hypothetical protein
MYVLRGAHAGKTFDSGGAIRVNALQAHLQRDGDFPHVGGAGILYDHFGSYEPMLWIIFLLALAAVSIMLFAKPEVRYQD